MNLHSIKKCLKHLTNFEYAENVQSSNVIKCKFITSLVMAALWNRAGHHIFVQWFLSSFFCFVFSSPNLSGRRLDVYHTSTSGVALVRI